jgi:hypothetical protein
MEAAELPGDSQWGFLLTLLPQVIAIIVAILGVLYGFREKRMAAKQGSQTIEKNTFDQLVNENKLLIKKMELLKKSEDKFMLLRAVVLKQDDGVQIIKAVEETADLISSNEQ